MTTENSAKIPPSRVPFFDQRTGEVSREWYRYLLNLDTIVQVGGDFFDSVAETDNNYTPSNNAEFILCEDSLTVVLQSSLSRQSVLTIINIGSGVVTIIPATGDTISGKSSLKLQFQWSAVQLCPYSGGYTII